MLAPPFLCIFVSLSLRGKVASHQVEARQKERKSRQKKAKSRCSREVSRQKEREPRRPRQSRFALRQSCVPLKDSRGSFIFPFISHKSNHPAIL